jgi:hypothetical protein
MSDDSLESIKGEIGFFMDKLFQSSFVYVGALFAALASTSLEATTALAAALGTTPGAILVIVTLSANLVFLVLACSCTFAILKRGMFIIESGMEATRSHLVRWETFVRRTDRSWGDLSWNVDNYYVGILVVLVFGSSIMVGIAGSKVLAGGAQGVTWVLLILHLVPMWMLWQVARINVACRRLVEANPEQKAATS